MKSTIYEVLNRNGKSLGFVQGKDIEECNSMAEKFYGDNFYSLHRVTSYPGTIDVKIGGTK